MSKMDLKYLALRNLVVLFILFKYIHRFRGSTMADFSTNSPNENYCVYDEEEVQENPWTATLQIHKGNIEDYYPVAILDEYTVLTYGTYPFKWIDDKLGFLPWSNYTVLIGAARNGNNVSFLQSLEVTSAQPHPDLITKTEFVYWMLVDNDYVVIHLKNPIELSPTIRPVCLPDLSAYNASNTTDDLSILYGENNTGVIGGWKKRKELYKTSLTIRLGGMDECEQEWRRKNLYVPFQNRVCGYVSQQNANNPDFECIEKDSGVLVSDSGGRGTYTFMGFVDNYYSDKGICNEHTIFFIFKLTPKTVIWLNATMTCGSSQYTCHNGECAPLSSVCNQLKDGCSDHSDEEPTYCRAMNPCTKDQFECGDHGPCIQKITDGKEAQKCDGVPDCPLNQDEENCPESETRDGASVPTGVWIGISLGIILLIVVPTLLWRRIMRRPVQIFPEKDIEEFEEGCEVEGASSIDKATNTPYIKLKAEYEIKSKYEIGQKIGSGYFSDVYKAFLLSKDHPYIGECAVKIPTSTDPEKVKGSLKEIKIMAHVGKHRNIVNFIGANTSKLREGILHILVELCEYGSMEDFLKKYRQGFSNLLDVSANANDQLTTSGDKGSGMETLTFNTHDLILWSSQVAAGMAHLANKQVVHGDLAARNILLDRNRTAKICDFGLSKQLYTDIQYVTSSRSRVPWKWMAVEALLENVLSTKSDVWSFGVALWEIFTLGNEPYGDLQWSPTFSFSLESTGCKLEQPELASFEIFQIMQKCWKVDPAERPSFDEIESNLLDCLEMTPNLSENEIS